MNPFNKLNKIKKQHLNRIDFKQRAKEVRNTEEWNQNRDAYLQDISECEWCGSDADIYHIHHTWGKSFSRVWMKCVDELFINSNAYDETLTEDRSQCPDCSYKDYYKRKTKSPKYRCNNCGNEFGEPENVDGSVAILSDRFSNKKYTTNSYHREKSRWADNNGESIFSRFDERMEDLMNEYVSLRDDQVVAICEKCHYKEERTNKRRCSRCGENWYNPNKVRDNMCWDCIVDENNLKKCPECNDGWYQEDKNEFCSDCR